MRTEEQEAAIIHLADLEALFDVALDAVDGDVVVLRHENYRLQAELKMARRDGDKALERALHWIEESRLWRDKYIAMRRERNEAIGQWVDYLTGQWQFETHLETEHDDVRRACAVDQRRQMASRMGEVVEMWNLKNDIEATDLGLDE